MRTISMFDHSFLVDDAHNPVFWKAVADKRWEVETFALLKNRIVPGAMFLDIGCWEGVFSLYAATIGARCHAIDADEVALHHCRKHLQQNPMLAPRITLHHVALAPTNGTCTLHARNTFGDSAASLLSRVRDVQDTVQVDSQTFEDFCRQHAISHLDFIKMDIEGGEYLILEGMALALTHLRVPTLYIAFHPQFLVEAYLRTYTRSALLGRIVMKCSRMARVALFKRRIQALYRRMFEQLMQDYEMKDECGETLVWQTWISQGECLIPRNIVFERRVSR